MFAFLVVILCQKLHMQVLPAANRTITAPGGWDEEAAEAPAQETEPEAPSPEEEAPVV